MARELSPSNHFMQKRWNEVAGLTSRYHYLSHVLLFIVAYAAFTAYLKPHARFDGQHQDSVSPVSAAVVAPMPVVVTPTTMHASSSMAVASVVPTAVAQNTVQRIEATPEIVAAPPIAEYSGRVAPVVQLQRMAEEDEHAENRLAAVRRLSAMATNGEQSTSVLRALQNASTDADETVAAAARTAYADLNARMQPRP